MAVVRALERCGAAGIMLKWPNDILHGHAKLGGILVELHADDGAAKAVVGIGLNLRLPESIGEAGVAALPPAALEQIVAALPERHVLLAGLLTAQEPQVRRAYARAGMRLAARMTNGDWSILWLRKRHGR